MATNIMSLFGNYDPEVEAQKRQQAFRQQLGGATDPQSFIAAVSTNLGSQLGGMFSKPTKQEKIGRIMQRVGKIADPLGQAQEAYTLFNNEGMAQEAQMMMERIQELQNAKKKEMLGNTLANTNFESPEDLLKAAKHAYSAGDATVGNQFLQAYRDAKGKVGKAPTTRQYYKANDIIYEQWDPEKNSWVEYGRAPRTTPGQKPDMIQNLEYQARRLGCDLKNEECYAKAQEAVITLKRDDAGAGKIMADTVKQLNELRDNALTNRTRIKNLDRALDIMDGKLGAKPITGALAGARLSVDKFAQLFGLKSKDLAASVTELLSQNRIEDAARLLATGAFGSGTAVSDRDLLSAFQSVGADMAMTGEGIRMILNQLRSGLVDNLDQYTKDIEGFTPDVFKASNKTKNYYLLDIPQRLAKEPPRPGAAKINTGKPKEQMTEQELRDALAKKQGNQ